MATGKGPVEGDGPGGLVLRPVEAPDVEAVVDLWREVFPEYADPAHPQRDPRANVERKLSFGDDLFWVAEIEGRVVGSVMAGWDGHRGWLYLLAVRPAWRRRGIARALLVEAESALAERGCPKVLLQVAAGNDAAAEFWRAHGYRLETHASFGKLLTRRD